MDFLFTLASADSFSREVVNASDSALSWIEMIFFALGSWVAYVGIFIVLLGVFVTIIRFLKFLFTGFSEERSAELRHSLMIYLSLGLDFLIAKDVILTLALENSDHEGLLQLAGVILVRILLSYFVHLEEKVLHRTQEMKATMKKRTSGSKRKSPKKKRSLLA